MRLVLLAATLGITCVYSQDISRPQPLRAGIEFESEDLKRLQSDTFANPGMLWVTKGEKLWSEKLGPGPACAGCHQDARATMKGVAARHPRFDASLGRVANLEDRIDQCNRRNQKGKGLARESDDLLALTAYVAHQSNGMPIVADKVPQTKRVLEEGRKLYMTRMGQMNLACTHCHDASWGKTLLNQSISQGHPSGWPAYRVEWQTLGSLQRRLRACFFGVRAEQPAFGSEELLALEVYLAARAEGMAAQAPGVRR
ncbi:sulfur oxidation c-type cytochrome SoxA [Usitatibacter palustris]|uniref:SoxAX cytochrome complex subunit A n=1 Tax=Usitatibacter palustris TaxID=2732487 RepID=A0A6M4H8W8_9PROT|nr:sulfur oxidation c-type cytochrome SoxA [Usitatibacter palustris]QJR16021.1 L-cysteine S-thiosulfotransferase subunit SoxA [Usitatibacter palustris]